MGNKSYFFDMLENVRKKILSLSDDNYIKMALSDDILNEIESKVAKLQENELTYEYYPPLFMFIYRHDLTVINGLNDDILLIKQNSSIEFFNNLITFLQASNNKQTSDKGVRKWANSFFEVFIKANLLKKFSKDIIKLDKKLQNGKNVDVSLKLSNKWMNFEVTMLSSSDEDYYAYDQYNEALKNNPNEVLIRPGKYDTPNSKSPSPYNDRFRIFGKIYDKITNEKLDVDKSQMSPNEPNVILLFIGDALSLLPYSPGVGWAFDELFAAQPKGKESPFIKWIHYKIKHLDFRNEWYCENLNKVISAPRKLSGVIIFNGCNGDIIESRINYNVNKENKISQKEMAEIEEIFKDRPNYFTGK